MRCDNVTSHLVTRRQRLHKRGPTGPTSIELSLGEWVWVNLYCRTCEWVWIDICCRTHKHTDINWDKYKRSTRRGNAFYIVDFLWHRPSWDLACNGPVKRSFNHFFVVSSNKLFTCLLNSVIACDLRYHETIMWRHCHVINLLSTRYCVFYGQLVWRLPLIVFSLITNSFLFRNTHEILLSGYVIHSKLTPTQN